MNVPKKYLHDRFILLLLGTNLFLAFLTVIIILFRVGLGQGADGYIVEYRANLGLSAFQKGDILPVISFGCFALLVTAINILLSMRVYHLRRTLALVVLALGALVTLLCAVVINALLALY